MHTYTWLLLAFVVCVRASMHACVGVCVRACLRSCLSVFVCVWQLCTNAHNCIFVHVSVCIYIYRYRKHLHWKMRMCEYAWTSYMLYTKTYIIMYWAWAASSSGTWYSWTPSQLDPYERLFMTGLHSHVGSLVPKPWPEPLLVPSESALRTKSKNPKS